MLNVTNIKKSFADAEVLRGIDLNVSKGDVIAVIGPSGSGKTTLLRCLNFLERADEGSFDFDGTHYDFKTVTKKQILSIRRQTGFVFQNYNLFRNKTVLQNVTESLIVAHKMNRADAIKKARLALQKVNMESKEDAMPHQISGGQMQRTAIARALATDPKIIYFDEPTSALDPELTGEVLDVMKNLADDGMTMIAVTHEMGFAKNVSDKTIFIENGLIVEQNNSKTFFEHPQNERTRQFISSVKTSFSKT